MKTAQTMQTGTSVRQVIENQHMQTATLPTTLSSVRGLTATADAWGHAIHYVPNSPTAGEFELVSDGPDGKPGTADDIHMDAATLSPATAP